MPTQRAYPARCVFALNRIPLTTLFFVEVVYIFCCRLAGEFACTRKRFQTRRFVLEIGQRLLLTHIKTYTYMYIMWLYAYDNKHWQRSMSKHTQTSRIPTRAQSMRISLYTRNTLTFILQVFTYVHVGQILNSTAHIVHLNWSCEFIQANILLSAAAAVVFLLVLLLLDVIQPAAIALQAVCMVVC